ncbi:unnamed protein product [Prorocentrum cordatum]|uniref:Uncharacterized protein n=1 Tax=Prorocentrum cordatum TaxID=2364126 RepID=A0ABN9Y4C0_9DINO|nr:unnamed protein product [Polarella glacialis]
MPGRAELDGTSAEECTGGFNECQAAAELFVHHGSSAGRMATGGRRQDVAAAWTCRSCTGRDGKPCISKSFRTVCYSWSLGKGCCFLSKVLPKEPFVRRAASEAFTQRERELKAKEAELRKREAAVAKAEKDTTSGAAGTPGGADDSPAVADQAKADRLRVDLEAMPSSPLELELGEAYQGRLAGRSGLGDFNNGQLDLLAEAILELTVRAVDRARRLEYQRSDVGGLAVGRFPLGVIAAPVGAACWARNPEPDVGTATLDFFAMARELRPPVEHVWVAAGAPAVPRSPLHLKLAGLRLPACVSQVRRRKAYPAEPWIGPRALPPGATWSWSCGAAPPSLAEGFREWFVAAAEVQLDALRDVGEANARWPGRAEGCRLARAPLRDAWCHALVERLDGRASMWKSFQLLAGQVAARPPTDDPDSSIAAERAFELLGQVGGLDAAMRQGALAEIQTAEEKALATRAAFARARWRAFAAGAVQRGGRIAHRRIKGPRPPAEALLEADPGPCPLPVNGAAALEVLLQFHPRWILDLPMESQRRFVDLVSHFEAQPEQTITIATMLVNVAFQGEPDGGARPTGLLPLLFKIYSRVRQPLCRAWGQVLRALRAIYVAPGVVILDGAVSRKVHPAAQLGSAAADVVDSLAVLQLPARENNKLACLASDAGVEAALATRWALSPSAAVQRARSLGAGADDGGRRRVNICAERQAAARAQTLGRFRHPRPRAISPADVALLTLRRCGWRFDGARLDLMRMAVSPKTPLGAKLSEAAAELPPGHRGKRALVPGAAVAPWSRIAWAVQSLQGEGAVAAERFARGDFPDPKRLWSEIGCREIEIHWWGRPASGRLEGALFSDGSAFAGRSPGVGRAGPATPDLGGMRAERSMQREMRLQFGSGANTATLRCQKARLLDGCFRGYGSPPQKTSQPAPGQRLARPRRQGAQLDRYRCGGGSASSCVHALVEGPEVASLLPGEHRSKLRRPWRQERRPLPRAAVAVSSTLAAALLAGAVTSAVSAARGAAGPRHVSHVGRAERKETSSTRPP